MSWHPRLCQVGILAAMAFVSGLAGATASAQIKTDIIEKYRAELQKQAADPEMKRERGTQPQDWIFSLPEGVRSRQITFYSDGTPCYGRIFFPKTFNARGRWPAVVVGHGINAQAVGIEKYAARFAERGLVAMAIDYRTYGYSGGDVLLLEPDTTTDERAVWEREARIQIKRTNLNNFRETEDFRAAISYIQTEPGVDPERIGVWGSSNGASVVLMVAAQDAPRKAYAPTGELPLAEQRRARVGYLPGAGASGDVETRLALAEYHPFWYVEQIPQKTAALFVVAEKGARTNNAGDASKLLKGPTDVARVPGVTRARIDAGLDFNTAANAAAEWFLKHL